jgi:hypothetical protein
LKGEPNFIAAPLLGRGDPSRYVAT